MKTDLSDYINNKIFFHLGKNRSLYFIVFFFKNLNFVKCNYKIYNKELLTIIYCFKQQGPEHKNIKVAIKVITNYKSLKYFIITKKFIRYQIC